MQDPEWKAKTILNQVLKYISQYSFILALGCCYEIPTYSITKEKLKNMTNFQKIINLDFFGQKSCLVCSSADK